MRLHGGVPKVPANPRQTQLRRRIPLELTPPELEVLEHAEARYGTKRATLVAGIEALARLEALEDQLAKATAACEQASTRAAELEEAGAALEEALAKAKGEAASAKQGRQAAERKRKAAKADADAVEDLLGALADEQQARLELEEELEQAQADLFDALRCSRCGEWASPKEWAIKEEADGDYVFHRPCGFHKGGILDPTSVLGFRGR